MTSRAHKLLWGFQCISISLFLFLFSSLSKPRGTPIVYLGHDIKHSLSFRVWLFPLFTPYQALIPCFVWPASIYTYQSPDNRPSTAPRGLQHAILKISISAELFGGRGMKSVCASGSGHETLSWEQGETTSLRPEAGGGGGGQCGGGCRARKGIRETKREEIKTE